MLTCPVRASIVATSPGSAGRARRTAWLSISVTKRVPFGPTAIPSGWLKSAPDPVPSLLPGPTGYAWSTQGADGAVGPPIVVTSPSGVSFRIA